MKKRKKEFVCNAYSWQEKRDLKNLKGILLDSDEAIEQFNVFLESLHLVDGNYYVYDLNEEILKRIDPHAKTKSIKQTERVFAYELYHQWSNLLNGWVLNAELFKHMEWFYPEEDDDAYPDMALHQGQNKDHQLIVCEIKRNNRVDKDIVKDLTRLYKFTRKSNTKKTFKPYKCGIFLAINANMKVITDSIYRHRLKLSKTINFNLVDNIICVASNYDRTISFQSLGEIDRQMSNPSYWHDTSIFLPKGLPKKIRKKK